MLHKLVKLGLSLCLMFSVGCGVAPQKLSIQPQLDFSALKGTHIPLAIMVVDKRPKPELLGYRNAKKEGALMFSSPLAKSLQGQLIKQLTVQGVRTGKTPDPQTQVKIEILKLDYRSPDKSWVSHIKMDGELVIYIKRGSSSLTKRFTANQAQDVVTAPSAEFNEQYLNTLLTQLLNKAMNDKEIVGFIK